MAAQPNRMYLYDNTVPQPDYEPQRRRKTNPSKKRKTKARRKRNARFMNAAYVSALTLALVVALFVCVNFVRLRKSISLYSSAIANTQLELADLREENNTKYNTIVDSVNMDEIRERAMLGLGMVDASGDQVIQYDNPSTAYVTQYQEIPENGVLVPSEDAKE